MDTQTDGAGRGARKRRNTLYLVGSAFAAAGITMGTMPMFAEHTPILMAKGCALLGALILSVGRFAPDHFLRRLFPARR
jgi:hypothetical protein